jgi:hypothetical protein
VHFNIRQQSQTPMAIGVRARLAYSRRPKFARSRNFAPPRAVMARRDLFRLGSSSRGGCPGLVPARSWPLPVNRTAAPRSTGPQRCGWRAKHAHTHLLAGREGLARVPTYGIPCGERCDRSLSCALVHACARDRPSHLEPSAAAVEGNAILASRAADKRTHARAPRAAKPGGAMGNRWFYWPAPWPLPCPPRSSASIEFHQPSDPTGKAFGSISI